MKNHLISSFAIVLFLTVTTVHAYGNRIAGNILQHGEFLGNASVQISDTTHLKKSLDIIDNESDSTAHIFSGNKIIQPSDTINGKVVVKGGNLTVYGLIQGDVLIVGGNIYLKQGGKITGTPHVIDGSIYRDDSTGMEGIEDTLGLEKTSYRETSRRFSKSGKTFDVPWRSEQAFFGNFFFLDNCIFRYNRVESIFLGIGTEKKYNWDGEKNWNAYGSIGWGFKSHTWRGNLGLTHQFAFSSDKRYTIIEVGAEGYTFTDTKDQWIISQNENTAAAFLIHEDFRNYFERKGYSIFSAWYSKHDYIKSEIKLAYLIDSYDSLVNKVDWSLFGGHKNFRLNPPINPGKMRSIMFSGGISTMTKTTRATDGWSAYGIVELAKKNWGSDFAFDQYTLDVRRFQPLGKYEAFNVRLRLGSSCGVLPVQKVFELGGLGTTNAFPFKSDMGNRMMLVNAEFIFNGNILNDLNFWPTWLFQHVNIILSTDAGFTRNIPSSAAATEGFSGIKLNEFHHDFGVAFGNRTGSMRIGFSWRTDWSAPLQFLLRLNRPF